MEYEEIQGVEEVEEGCFPEIFQWKVFLNFHCEDYSKLIEAKVPVLDSKLGTWVGLTSYGSPYEVCVYPELIKALFGEVIASEHQKTA